MTVLRVVFIVSSPPRRAAGRRKRFTPDRIIRPPRGNFIALVHRIVLTALYCSLPLPPPIPSHIRSARFRDNVRGFYGDGSFNYLTRSPTDIAYTVIMNRLPPGPRANGVFCI